RLRVLSSAPGSRLVVLHPVGRRSGDDPEAAIAPELLLGPEALGRHDNGNDGGGANGADPRCAHDSSHFGYLRSLFLEPCFRPVLGGLEGIDLSRQALGTQALRTLELAQRRFPSHRVVDTFVDKDAAGSKQSSKPVLCPSRFSGGY